MVFRCANAKVSEYCRRTSVCYIAAVICVVVPVGVVIITTFSGETSILYPAGRKEVKPLSSDGCP